MAKFESKYSINDNIKFSIKNIIFNGKIINVIFASNGIFYDIETINNIYKNVEEDIIF